ncbi:MAG: polysaccharide pyruvyl transferase family protein [Candidatus Omnitrophica bacterium]|nr:polysaccharide pyruvyl transferase family protein [Candidatus Omnitrophota bacterium]
MSDGHVVSVIIPTIDRPTLQQSQEALRAQTRPADEVIVIHDTGRRGVSWARNEGIRRSRGDLIVFADDDCVPPRDWLEQLVRAVDRDAAGIVVGGCRETDPLLDAKRRRRGAANRVQPSSAYGGNVLYRRSCLEACAAQDGSIFQEAFGIGGIGGEDVELAGRLRARGVPIVFVPVDVTHLKRVTPRGYWAQQFGRGQGIAALFRAARSGRVALAQQSLLWDHEAQPKARRGPRWLLAVWRKLVGPFDVKSFPSLRHFLVFWAGEKCEAAGFAWGLLCRRHGRPQAAPRVCLWGTSLHKVADEAQMIAACDAIRLRMPQARITLFARPNGVFEREAAGIEVIPTARIIQVLRRLARSDLFVIVGGPFLENRAQVFSCALLIGAARLWRRPVVTFGSTILDYKTRWGRWWYRRLFERIDAIAVREEVGLRQLHALGVRSAAALVGDPRILLTPAPAEEIRGLLRREGFDGTRPLIGLTTRHLSDDVPVWVKRTAGYTPEHVAQANVILGRTISALSQRADVVLLPMHPTYDEDLKTAEAIRDTMADPSQLNILSRAYRARELIGLIAACELLIAGRLGSAIFATAAGTPVLGVAYESRLPGYLEQIGCGRYVRDWRALDDTFVRLAEELWSDRATVQRQMQGHLAHLKSQAAANGELIARWARRDQVKAA